jgi:phosphatidyl-myo-inositol dimannoside synthase
LEFDDDPVIKIKKLIYIPSQVLFLALKVFSATGGIEKVCRIAGKALYEFSLENNVKVKLMSMHDHAQQANDNPYFPAEIFEGYNAAKSKFILAAVNEGRRSKTVILSHVNLLPAAWLIKKANPATKLILMAHGIEIWKKLSPVTRNMLLMCDEIVSVSNFTATCIKERHGVDAQKSSIINNCIDPFLEIPHRHNKNEDLLKRYGFTSSDKILLTLTRLTLRDRYKGYDVVIRSLVSLKKRIPEIKYLLAGKYDSAEKRYLEDLIKECDLEQTVVLSGFVEEDELPDIFSLADIYVMPSMKEGFGIVFVEAMYYGVPVIAGNADGSADALLNGELGLLIKPELPELVSAAVEKMFADIEKYIPDQKLLMKHFGYEVYKRKLEAVL